MISLHLWDHFVHECFHEAQVVTFWVGHSVASDTCEALEEYIQAPANTTLDSLLPCVDLAAAGTAFTLAREVIYNGIETVRNHLPSL